MGFPDLGGFAYSFSHAVLKVDDTQYMGVSGVRISQPVTESPVYGTGRGPLRRSAGQVGMGSGQLTFSDFEDATAFIKSLSDPLWKIWTLDYALILENGSVRSIECQSCRLLDISIDHQAGAEAVGAVFPFSFLRMRIDGVDVFLSPKALLSAGLGIAKNLVNLL